MNAVEPVEGGVLMSARHVDAVYKIDRRTGGIVWKLGGTRTAKSLKVKGLKGYPLSGQHDVRRLPDGTITISDNGTDLKRGPRMLRFRIDERRRTATLVQTVHDPRVHVSGCCGSSRRLPNGNWLLDYGTNSEMAEVTKDSRTVWRMRFPQPLFTYRAVPARYVTKAQLRAGMNAMASP
jgi:hypothetical protein